MPRLFDDVESAEVSELMSQMFGEAGLDTSSNQMPPPDLPHSPEDAQISSAERFASLVHSPVSPAFKSARSSTRSSLARQLNGSGDTAKSPAQSKDVKDGENGEETSAAPATPRQSSRRQAKPARKAASPVKRERAKRSVDVKSAIRKSGRPARAQPARAQRAKAQPAKAQPAKAQPVKRRGRPAGKAKEFEATGKVKGGRKEWEVEKIIDSRIEEETLEHYFRVKWKGFSDKDNTWEPKKNLANCKGLVEAYEKKAEKKAGKK
ncbi:chromo (CHRromatin organization MOdifier) domain-containing protein [Trichoderma breve]|uniref:Chromo (CHRromatin organization MOdifier) domain-containing protein n=1 Tax=Trichoderma breve TaxID=2034170 RepID=A0A9W9BFI8_9HYPO|nr:chromo (CHRromatin organization MOdifier) domain-containing protein [Trichoderma breve]KAJ4862407.1 chromo (CHRromatin organization MOdifier) domain-containing protein [Trichoderma breve]